jgi:hypothetical protein
MKTTPTSLELFDRSTLTHKSYSSLNWEEAVQLRSQKSLNDFQPHQPLKILYSLVSSNPNQLLNSCANQSSSATVPLQCSLQRRSLFPNSILNPVLLSEKLDRLPVFPYTCALDKKRFRG